MKKIITAILLSALSLLANAQTVKIIVPFGVGGPADQIARAMQINLSKRLPYTFLVEHHIGAAGVIAAKHVAKYAGSDTLILIHSPAIITNSFNDNIGYNFQEDFVPIAKLGSVPMVLLTNSNGAYTSIDKILKSDKPMFYGTAGFGGALHLAGETFKRQTKKDMTAVPYKGDAAALNDVLTNNLSFSFTNLSTAQGMLDSNQVVVLGITGTRRNSKLPNVPTMLEQGVNGFETSPNWMSLFTNHSANADVINNIKKSLAESYKDPVEVQSYTRSGVDVDIKHLLAAPEFITGETVRIRRLLSTLALQK
jgi:tripartite-type tricarboxylate transporter receptor subunit TctC